MQGGWDWWGGRCIITVVVAIIVIVSCTCRRCRRGLSTGASSPGRGPFSGLGRERGLVVKEALDKLCPVIFCAMLLETNP
jgi:hypothetical protein